jgi:hypothetical protein
MTPYEFNIMAALWLSVSFLAGMMAYAMYLDFLNWLGGRE